MEPENNNLSHQRSKRSKTTHLPLIPHNLDLSSIFPPEIVTEILSRLSVKSLSRFRCVSKAWCALISSPQFAKLHLKLSSSRKDCAHLKILSYFLERQKPYFSLMQCSLQSLMLEPVVEAVEVDHPMKSTHDVENVVGTCNGLICIELQYYNLLIWNPTTGKFKKLPKSSDNLENLRDFAYGFGYDELNDDYKVVGIFYTVQKTDLLEKLKSETMVYGLRSDSWRRIEDFSRSIRGNTGKHVKGKIHWPVCHNDVSKGWEIISLDLAREVYEKVDPPDFGETMPQIWKLGVVCSYLSMICQYESSHMDLWFMKEYGMNGLWTKMVTLPPLELYVHRNAKFSCFPVCFVKNGEFLLMLGSRYALYDSKNKAFCYPEITNFGASSVVSVETCVESLVSPIVDSEAGREQQQ